MKALLGDCGTVEELLSWTWSAEDPCRSLVEIALTELKTCQNIAIYSVAIVGDDYESPFYDSRIESEFMRGCWFVDVLSGF